MTTQGNTPSNEARNTILAILGLSAIIVTALAVALVLAFTESGPFAKSADTSRDSQTRPAATDARQSGDDRRSGQHNQSAPAAGETKPASFTYTSVETFQTESGDVVCSIYDDWFTCHVPSMTTKLDEELECDGGEVVTVSQLYKDDPSVFLCEKVDIDPTIELMDGERVRREETECRAVGIGIECRLDNGRGFYASASTQNTF